MRWKLTWRSRARRLPPKCRRPLRPAVALGQHPSRARGRLQQPTKRSNRPKCAPVPETAEAAARLPSVLVASGLRAACESAAMRWLRDQLTWCGRESLHRTSENASCDDAAQARMPQQDIAGLFALLYSARNFTLQMCPVLAVNEVCCAFTDTPSPKLWRRETAVFLPS